MAFFPEPVTYAEGHALTCAKKMCKEELLRLKELNDWSVYKKKYSASVLTRIRTLILPLQIWMTIMYNWNEYIFGSTLGGCDDVYEWLVKSSCNRTSKNLPKTPTIRFTDVDCVDCLPTVSTCDVSLMFPRKMALLQFQTFCIKGSYGFGTI